MLSISYVETSGTAAYDGIFIPVTDLPGLLAAELATSETDLTKESKALYSMMRQMVGKFTDKLGITFTQGAVQGIGVDLFSETYSFSQDWIGNFKTNTFEVLPLPVAGNLVGVNSVPFTDVFPNATKISSAGSISSAGILIDYSKLITYGAVSFSTLDLTEDCRDVISAFMYYVAYEAEQRDATFATGILATTTPLPTIAELPVSAFATVNPTTSLSESENNSGIYTLVVKTASVTFELKTTKNQTFDLNIALAA